MSEQNNEQQQPSSVDNLPTSSAIQAQADTVASNDQPSLSKPARTGTALAVLALLLGASAVAGVGFGYWQWQQFTAYQQQWHSQVQQQMAELQGQAERNKQELSASMQQGGRALEQQNQQQWQHISEQWQQAQQQIQSQLDAQLQNQRDIALLDAVTFSKAAGNALWLQRDPAMALQLLSRAEQTLAAANQPQWLAIRQTLADDITTIKAIHVPDVSALYLQIAALEQQVQRLPLRGADFIPDPAPARPTEPLTGMDDWLANAKKTWAGIMDDFIKVRSRDMSVEPLLPVEQTQYVRLQVRHAMNQAQTALLKQNNAVYQSALAKAETWLGDFFDVNDSAVQQQLVAVQQLKAQRVDLTIPEQLTSLEPLEQLLLQRQQAKDGQ